MTNQATQNKTEFTNLRNKATQELKTKYQTHIEDINSITDKSVIFGHWMYSGNLSKLRQAQLKNDLITLEQAKEIIKKKVTKKHEKELTEVIQKIESVENAPSLIDATITIEWKANRTWGSNPNAEIKIQTSEHYLYDKSGSIGGCGYDKGSTATAKVLNASPSVLKLFYTVYNDNTDKTARDLFTYGMEISWQGLPYFSGGVGVSCHQRNFESVGWQMKHIANGKTFDVYYICRK